VIDSLSQPADGSRDPAVAIATLVKGEDGLDAVLERGMPIGQRRNLPLIIERAARQACQLQQAGKRMERP
jgi:hypothetical protein